MTLAGAGVLLGQPLPEYEQPPINYTASTPTNPVSQLQARLLRQPALLRGTNEWDTVHRWLDALHIPAESQVLVFSKTSLQRRRIDPAHPRAVFFSDHAYLGWVPGGLMEIAVSDPGLGLVFYRVDARDAVKSPEITRDEECLSCHAGPLTRGWPALLVRSIYPDADGEPIARAGGFLVEHDTPLTNRWGGWLVTGDTSGLPHLGNAIAHEEERRVILERAPEGAAARLARQFPPGSHTPVRSPIVSLMVLEHQVGMHNRLVEGGLRVRKWTHYQRALQKELGEPITDQPTGTALRVVQSEAERIVAHLLFADEAPLPPDGLPADPAFAAAFRADRRTDPQGRSLKDFDLHTRLFAWPCSFMIDSAAFHHLPASLRREIYRRLSEALEPGPADPKFKHLTPELKAALREILPAVIPELARAWKQ